MHSKYNNDEKNVSNKTLSKIEIYKQSMPKTNLLDVLEKFKLPTAQIPKKSRNKNKH